MTTITRQHVDQGLVTEDKAHHFSAFASDLRIRRWPDAIDTELGNGLIFNIVRTERREGDVQWVDYRQVLGCITLRIFNT